MITCKSHRENFNAAACFLLELLGHQWLLLYFLLYFCAVLWTLIKMEQTIEKSPNFQQTLLNTWASFSQKFNDVAVFILDLLGFDFDICIIFLRSFSKNNKKGTNNWKGPNFQQILLIIPASLSQNFNVVALFVVELSGLVFYIYTIFLCCFSKINKNGTNNSAVTKLSANTFGHSDKPQPKVQCCSCICSWVIRLSFIYIYIYIYTIFLCHFSETYKNGKNNWKITQLSGNTLEY